jgi:peroxidase
MKKITYGIFASLTILVTACQGMFPNQLSIPFVNVNYVLENQEPSFSSDVRSLDGLGNNLANPSWGSVNEQFVRISPVDYADGMSLPTGVDRPSPRVISNTFSVNTEEGILNARDFSAFVYAWGQFLDHDMTLSKTAEPKESILIIVPSGDVWFDPLNTGTMIIPLSRSNYDVNTGNALETPRQQINSLTAFVDGSQIYGVDEERAAALREFVGGRLKMSEGNFLPFNTEGFENANDAHRVEDSALFLAGDVRANENPELIAMHTLFVREHNRIADETSQRHPNWTDDELYQYARRMVIAELQVITYEEFLPAMLGENALPVYQGYDANINPGISNEFATAAFRLGHSMLGADIEFLDNDLEEVRAEMELREAFFNPSVVTEVDIDPILKYLASDVAQEVDTKVVDDVRNFLFGAPGQGGFDLAALNIQRGREHGLADYNTVRLAYGLPRVTSFAEITSDPAMQASLASTYGNVDNIDLWIGGLAEDHLPNSSLGETFTAILIDQFSRLRAGDRFWYEHTFSGAELEEIKNITLADVIRLNTDLTKLQENVFFYNEETTVMIEESITPLQEDDSSNNQSTNNGRGDGKRGKNPPQVAIEACVGLSENASCSFIGRHGNALTGTCETVQNSQFACVPAGSPLP